jgi:hypothetical protein
MHRYASKAGLILLLFAKDISLRAKILPAPAVAAKPLLANTLGLK